MSFPVGSGILFYAEAVYTDGNVTLISDLLKKKLVLVVQKEEKYDKIVKNSGCEKIIFVIISIIAAFALRRLCVFIN